MNNLLPFDILSCIFNHYQQQEDVFHPLETLLLVCKSWSEVALSNHALWGRFNIRLGHDPVMRMWKKRLRLRLMRSGPIVPLDIDIRSEKHGKDLNEEVLRNSRFYASHCFDANGSSMWRCNCYHAHRETITWILEELVGQNEVICRRWKRFGLHNPEATPYVTLPGSSTAALSRALTSATPSLISLSLSYIRYQGPVDPNRPMLPFVPLLREVTFQMCHLPGLPALPALKSIDLEYFNHRINIPIRLEEASRLQELTLRIHEQRITLPPVLPDLLRLTLDATTISSVFDQIFMPRLTRLTIQIWNWQSARELSECSAFPLEQLTDLEIQHPRNSKQIYYTGYFNWMVQFLRRCVRLRSISSSVSFFNFVIKWIWEEKHKSEADKTSNMGQLRKGLHWEQGVLLISSSRGTIGRLYGTESPAQLEFLAREWGLSSPAVSWDTLISILYRA